MAEPISEADMAARLLAEFEKAGAERVDPGFLQPAGLLLDLYGEDIRARAYTTSDAVHGEQMLRPDFTVPVVRQHMDQRKDPARYTYAGPVWRRQEYGSTRTREFWQVGFEVFDSAHPALADAQVFALIARSLEGVGAVPITGDLGFLFAAIGALDTTEARKTALRRHVWRPGRFARLLRRFSGEEPFASDAVDWPENVAAALEKQGQDIGLRSREEVAARIAALKLEAETPPLSVSDQGLIHSVLAVRGKVSACFDGLQAIGRGISAMEPVLDKMQARIEALAAAGINLAELDFDASFGRTTMEYYDGFVFAFRAPDGLPEVATGGRYDALTKALGSGASASAVGGVIRPAVLSTLQERRQ